MNVQKYKQFITTTLLNQITRLSVFVFVVMFYCLPQVVAQVNTSAYQFITDSTGSLLLDRNGNDVSFSGVQEIIPASTQQVNSTVIQLPFSVFFMGSTYSHFVVNVNGAVVLAPSASISFSASQANNYTSVNSQYVLLAPFWDVLTTSANRGVRYTVTGNAPYRSLVVEWVVQSGLASTSSNYDMHFQCRFYETTNIVEYVYGKMSIGKNQQTPVTASIGFSTNAAATDGSFLSVMRLDSLYTTSLRTDLTASQNLVNSSTYGSISALHSNSEGTRKRIAFVPQPINAPGNLSAFNVATNGALLYWDEYSNDELGFKLYRVNKNELIPDTTVAPNITFRTLVDLLPTTSYQYRVQVYNNYTSAYSNPVWFTTLNGDTLRAIKSGNWNDTATWGGLVPTKNTVVEIPSAVVVNFNVANGYCHQLTVWGKLTFANQSTAQKLVVNADVVCNGIITSWQNPTYNNVVNELLVGKNLVNNGVLKLFNKTASYQNGISVRFNGDEHSQFIGAGDTTDVYQLICSKDRSTDSLFIAPKTITIRGGNTTNQSVSALFGTASLHKGIIYLGGQFTLQNPMFTDRTIASSVGFTVDNQNVEIDFTGGDATVSISSTLQVKNGVVKVGASLVLKNQSQLIVAGGKLTIGAQLKNDVSTSSTRFIQSGGVIQTVGLGLSSIENCVNLTGGQLFSTSNIQLLSDKDVSIYTKHKLYVVSAFNVPFKQATISGNFASLYVDSLQGSTTIIRLLLNGDVSVYEQFVVQLNDSVELANNSLTLHGDSTDLKGWITGLGSLSKLVLASNTHQVITGLGGLKVYALEVKKSDTTQVVSLSKDVFYEVNSLGLFGGKIVGAKMLHVGFANINSLVKVGDGSDDGVASVLDSVPSYTNGKRVVLQYNQTKYPFYTGNEIPFTRTVYGLLFSNTNGVFISDSTIWVSDSLVLNDGVVFTSNHKQVIFTDTIGVINFTWNDGYFNGPFTRYVTKQQQKVQFPIGATISKAVDFYPVASFEKAIPIEFSYAADRVNGMMSATLRNLADSGYWQLSNKSNQSFSFTIGVADENLNARTRLVYASSVVPQTNTSTLFNTVGKRVSFYVDSLVSNQVTASTPYVYFTKAEVKPDTLFGGIYKIGDGEPFETLTDVSTALATCYIDSSVVFEITPRYRIDKEIYPIAFEKSEYTQTARGYGVHIKLEKNVSGLVLENTNALPNGLGLLNFVGATHVCIDGKVYDELGQETGLSGWILRTSTASTVNPVIQFMAGATKNQVSNLKLVGNNTLSTSGTLAFVGKDEDDFGNSENRVLNNSITSRSTTALSANHIYSESRANQSNQHNSIVGNAISDFSQNGILISAIGNGSNWKVNSNRIYQTFASSNTTKAISFLGGKGSTGNQINWNTLGGNQVVTTGAWSYSGTAVLTSIQISVDTGGATIVSDNTIKSYTLTNTATTAGYSAIQIDGGNVEVRANKIGATDVLGKINIAGRGSSSIIKVTANLGFTKLADNVITNIEQNQTGSSLAKLRGISIEGTAPVALEYNTIAKLNSFGTAIIQNDAALVGIFVGGSSGDVNLNRNVITDLNMLSTGYVTGISVNRLSSGTVNGNKVSNINNASTTAGRYITGITVDQGNWLVKNNKIIIRNAGNEGRSILIHGLRVAAPVSASNRIYHNTVFIGGTTNGTTITTAGSFAYYQSISGAQVTSKNNVFVNTRGTSNIHPAAYTILGAATVTDFNYYYATNSTGVISTSGTLRTFDTYKTLSTNEKNSASGALPDFDSTLENFTPSSTGANCVLKGAGVKLSDVDDDFIGNSRSANQPDLGADEFTYAGLLTAPVLISGNDTLCLGSTRTLRVTPAQGGNDIQWFTTVAGGNPIFTGFDFQTGAITNDTVFYAQVKSNTCKSLRTAIPINVKSTPAINVLNVPLQPICSGNSILLAASTPANMQVKWYADSNYSNVLATAKYFNTGVLANDTTFYAEASNGICNAARTQVNIRVNNTILLPPTGVDSVVRVCKGNTVELKANSTEQLEWYAANGLLVSTDSILVMPALTTDTTFFVAAVNGVCSSSKKEIKVVVNNDKTVPSFDSVITVCGNHPFSLTAQQNNLTHKWYTNFSDTVPALISNSISFASLEYDTTLYYSSNNGVCELSNKFQVAIKPIRVNTPEINFTNKICKNASVTIDASSPNQINWYKNLTDSVSIKEGFSFTLSKLNKDTILYVQAVNGNCASERLEVMVDVVDSVLPPTIISNEAVCSGNLASINVSGAYPVKWFVTPSSVDVLSEDTVLNLGVLSADTLLYVSAKNGACESVRNAVRLQLKPSPQPPVFTTLPEVCQGNSSLLHVVSTDSIKWFSSTTSSTVLGTGEFYRTPKLVNNTNYYVESTNGFCRSKRLALPITVLTGPATPVMSELNYRTCFNEPVVLKASSVNQLNWYAQANGLVVLQRDSILVTDRLKNDTTFFVESFDGICRSERVMIPVSVLGYLGNAQIQLPDSAILNQEINVAATGLASSIFSWQFDEGASLSGASGQGPFNLSYSTPGRKAIRLTISRRSGNLMCDTTLISYFRVVDTTNYTGVNQYQSGITAFNVYPNPASVIVHVTGAVNASSLITIQLFDTYGKVVVEKLTQVSSRIHEDLDVSMCVPGIYLVRVLTPHSISTSKLIIK